MVSDADREVLAQRVMHDEGFRGRMYKDTRGKWTIGYGFNLSDRALPEPIGRQLLMYGLNEAIHELESTFPWYEHLDGRRQRALANMVYNMGIPTFLGFKKLLAALEAQDWVVAAGEMKRSAWYGQVGARADRLIHDILGISLA